MKTDITSAIINSFGLLFFFIANLMIILQVGKISNMILQVWIILYGITMIIFWPIQIIYHIQVYKKKNPDLLRRIDRGSTLFLVVSVFSPLLTQYTTATFSLVANIILWIAAGFGMTLILTLKNLSRKLAPILGFLLGIFGIITLLSYMSNIPQKEFILFICGAGCLMISGVIYAIKKPDLKPDIYGFHELFHTFMTIGAIILHFLILMAIGY